ncbi:MAG: insulinase family protein [Pseudomonadota bacterium]
MTHSLVRRACLALLLALPCAAQAQIKLDDPIPVGPQVRVGTLANGLRYYIQKNAKPAGKLELRLVLKVGSILEDEDQQGLAHFAEHMAFNGSANFKKNALISYLESIGVKMGADLNAYTGFNETVYILPIPTDNKENVAKGFLVLEDWAHGLTLEPASIDEERGIVLEELRLGKGAADRLNKVVMPKVFNGSLYARRLPIGQEEVLKTFKPATLARFYRDWYRPDLMAVVAVGDIEPAEAQALIERHFGKLKNPAAPRARTATAIPARAASEALVVTDAEARVNTLLIRYPVQAAPPETHFRDYRANLVNSLFSAMLSQRLRALAQQADPPFMAGGSGVSRMTQGYRSYASSASLGQGGAAPAIAALVRESERARRFGFSAPELERAKLNLLRSVESAWEKRDKTNSAEYAAEYIRNFLDQEAIPGVENEVAFARELCAGIGLDDVNAYARAAIPAQAPKLVVYTGSGQPGAPAPAGESLLAAVAAAEAAPIAAPDPANPGKALPDALMAPPKPGAIVAETRDEALGTTTLTLSNGVRVLLKPTDFSGDQVALMSTRYGGELLFDDKDNFNARYADEIVTAMGTGQFTPLELEQMLAGKKAVVSAGQTSHTDFVRGLAGSKDVEAMLQLLHLRFSGVRRDEVLYRSYIGKRIEVARNAQIQPEARFQEAILETLYGRHPRVARGSRPEDFDQVSLERAVALHRARFSSVKGFTFVIVGSFDPAAIKPLLATYLASLPATELPLGFRDVGIRPVKGVVKTALRAGSEPKSSVVLNFTGEASWSEDEALRLQAMIDVINIRVREVLREKLALIYGGGLRGTLGRIPYQHYSLVFSYPTGPANVARVIEATHAEIARMKAQGPDQADLEKVRTHWLQKHRENLRTNGYWLAALDDAARDGTDPARLLGYEQRVGAITAAQLRDAARRYFDPANMIEVVMNPEK